MSAVIEIPVIDLFAGPGGLGEGFSSVHNNKKRVFDIRLSIEKDENAHSTLELRSFFRQFNKDNVPDEFYAVLREPEPKKRLLLKKILFEKYPNEYEVAQKETWKAELGASEFPPDLVNVRIKKALGKAKNWVLIGGPPCQAYSLVGRSRVGGINPEDNRVYLYKEYLRILAVHQPAIFVMENVKGLLSAKVNGEKVFRWILRDLKDPSLVFQNIASPSYNIYSLTTEVSYDSEGRPFYKSDSDYIIKAEKYSIPQKRHRIILLGIRDDINFTPEILRTQNSYVTLKSVIGDLPKIRSGLNRTFISSELFNGKKKRYYRQEKDTNENWENLINSFRKEIISWDGFRKNYPNIEVKLTRFGIGSEYIIFKTPSVKNPLYEWYNDPELGGVCNHVSRSHLVQDLKRYLFSSMFTKKYNRFPRLHEYNKHSVKLLPDHENAESGKFADRFRVQLPDKPATTITSHISKDGHYYIHPDPSQCRSLTVREAARIQTFPDNYYFCGPKTSQYIQVGNAVPPLLANQIAWIVYKLFEKIEAGKKT